MTLGMAERQGDLLDDVVRFCNETLPPDSMYGFLHRERDHLFPDEFFADLFSTTGRNSVPPSVVATIMVLQRLGGLSDREAVDRFAFDTRWRYAAGVGGYDGGGWWTFAHTVLVDMRERLRRSERPNRVFEVTKETAAAAGMVGRRRILDSTPLYDAVATMDTITLIRSAMRGLLLVAGEDLEARLRAACTSGDEYTTSAKPQIDWECAGARNALIDTRARDAFACMALLDGTDHGPEVATAAELLAAVVGQDLESGADGIFRIARKVAPDRIISTVDTQTRHGHKTKSRSFDGYKGHIAIDPDSEIVTSTAVSAGNVGDAAIAEELLADTLPTKNDGPDNVPPIDVDDPDPDPDPEVVTATVAVDNGGDAERVAPQDGAEEADTDDESADAAEVFGDSAYGTGPLLERLEDAGVVAMVKVQAPHAPGGRFTKDAFVIDLKGRTVTCPNGVTADIRPGKDGSGIAGFSSACARCPLLLHCTKSETGRTISVGVHESQLVAARERQRDPDWKERYRSTRPKVERKLGHMMRRQHGGRRARVRGHERVAQDFAWLGAVTNLARMATRGLTRTAAGGWATATV